VAFIESLQSSGWLNLSILKLLRPFTIPTGIQLAPDSIMQLICCAASVTPPKVQWIVVTRDMALVFWIYNIL
jgi:hypothetical protein